MDKAMKVEIENILEEYFLKVCDKEDYTEEMLLSATSSLTSLIIKWLEGKRVIHDCSPNCRVTVNCKHGSRNQLITELVEELK